ncbi:MAG: helix-turn-helix transcriptional regulator [Methylocella sp.]
MKNSTTPLLDPKILGFWTRCLRETQHMSQDALAASSSLDVRTIQRIEAGQGASVTTRRCLARGLGYEKLDTFDDPEFVMRVHKLLENAQAIKKEAQEKQYPDHVRLKTARVQNGETLGRLADISNAVVLNADDAISDEAKNTAATLFDYVRDLLDLGDVASWSEKVGYNRDLEALLRQLEGLGATVYSALRPMKMCGENWEDKTPVSLEVGYLTVVPTENVLEDMFVPRRCRLSF